MKRFAAWNLRHYAHWMIINWMSYVVFWIATIWLFCWLLHEFLKSRKCPAITQTSTRKSSAWGCFEEQSNVWAQVIPWRSFLEISFEWVHSPRLLDWPARLRSISAFSDKRLPGLHGSDSIIACSTLVFIFDSSACFCVVLIYVCHLICTCSCEVRQGLFSIICYKCLKPRHNHDWYSR